MPKVLLAWCLVLAATAARPDYVYDGETEYWGKVVSAAGDKLLLNDGCDPGKQVTLNKKAVTRVIFGPDCKKSKAPNFASGLAACDKPVRGFNVRAEGLKEPLFVEDFLIQTSGRVRLTTPGGSAVFLEPGKLQSLNAVLKCMSSADDLLDGPHGQVAEGVCVEPRQWAVNFTGKPVSRNAIFTQGFSVLITGLNATEDRDIDVRQAFGHALTYWVSALQKARSELDPELQKFLADSFQCSAGGTCLLTPPQVVRRYCQEAAMFQVRWLRSAGPEFAGQDDVLLAKAAVQGRTLLLNAARHRFQLKPGSGAKSSDGQFNLVAVLAHELGHAFGLPDVLDGTPSIMSATVSGMSDEPTNADAKRLARELLKEIQGSPPGVISLDQCAGLSSL